MPIEWTPPKSAERRAELERQLERMLQLRGPVTEVRRLLAEIDSITSSASPPASPGEPPRSALANRQAQDQMAH